MLIPIENVVDSAHYIDFDVWTPFQLQIDPVLVLEALPEEN